MTVFGNVIDQFGKTGFVEFNGGIYSDQPLHGCIDQQLAQGIQSNQIEWFQHDLITGQGF